MDTLYHTFTKLELEGKKMSESFKKLLGYMGYISNCTNYESWSLASIGMEFRDVQDRAKAEFAKEVIDWSELSDEEYKLLRFKDWDETTKNIIPLWLFRLLPDSTELVSFSGEKTTVENADDDIRFGCVAYSLGT